MTSFRRRYWFAGGALLLAFVCLLPCLLQGPSPYDEGIMVEGAVRTAHGALPYRDFYAIYAPGGFYALAAIFRLFGPSLLVERIWRALVRFAVCLVVYAISRRFVSRTASYLACLLTALVLQTGLSFGFLPEAMFWSLLGVLVLLLAYPVEGLEGVFLSGAATGVETLFRHEMGVYTCFSAALAMVLFSMLKRQRARFTLKALLTYGSGVSAIVVPALIGLVRTVPPADLRTDFLDFPRIQTQFRLGGLPPLLPNLYFFTSQHMAAYDWFGFYAPIAVLLISWIGLVRRRRNREAAGDGQEELFGWILLTVLGSSFVMRGAIRQHSELMTVPAIILLPLLLGKSLPGNWRGWSAKPVRVALLVLAVGYAGTQLALNRYLLANLVRHTREGTSSLARARGFYVDPEMEATVRYIEQNVPDGEAIYVGNAQHHQVFVNDAIIYFLAGRRPGTRFHDLIPGVITTAPVQREVICDLARNQVDYIVINTDRGLARFEGQPSTDSGVGLLDDFLSSQYKETRTFGSYSVRERIRIRERIAGAPPAGGNPCH